MKQSGFRVFRVGEIRPNPFRAIERYPLQDEKIKALRESIRSTSFWDNLVARIGDDDKPEIAYGHHRLKALRKELGDDFEVRLIIKDLDDTQMLKIMLRENMEEWQTNALADQASVRAVVDAYAAGKIELLPPNAKSPKNKLRYAPGFCQGYVPGGDREDHPYTVATLAGFLGWDRTKVEETTKALELMEDGLVKESLYKGMTQSQARVLTNEVHKVVTTANGSVWALEREAKIACKRAEEAEGEDERMEQERLAKSALQEAEAVRKRMEEQAGHIAWSVHLGVRDNSIERRISAELLMLTDPIPPAVESPWGDADAIHWYLQNLGWFGVEVRQIRALADLFSPEQMEEAVQGGLALQEELSGLETALKEVVRERQERGAAPLPLKKQKRRQRGKEAKAPVALAVPEEETIHV